MQMKHGLTWSSNCSCVVHCFVYFLHSPYWLKRCCYSSWNISFLNVSSLVLFIFSCLIRMTVFPDLWKKTVVYGLYIRISSFCNSLNFTATEVLLTMIEIRYIIHSYCLRWVFPLSPLLPPYGNDSVVILCHCITRFSYLQVAGQSILPQPHHLIKMYIKGRNTLHSFLLCHLLGLGLKSWWNWSI